MKDYYTIKQEIIICETTIRRLNNKKDRLLMKATNTTGHLKDDIVSGGVKENSIEVYAQRVIDEIEGELTEKEEELKELLISKGKIEAALRTIARNKNKDLERIFVYKYIDGLNYKQISRLMPCSIATVYNKLDEIKRII